MPLAEKEVYDISKKMSAAKEAGADNISVKRLKYDLLLVTRLLRHIVNLSLSTLIVPDQWKCAIVKPLYKDGPRNSASNYSPISILPACSKILEKSCTTSIKSSF